MTDSLRSYVAGTKASAAGSTQSFSMYDLGQSISSSASSLLAGQMTSGSEPQQAPPPEDSWFTQAAQDPCLPTLSKKQRIMGFFGCLIMGAFCFFMCSLYLPFLVLKARKFALMYTLGSLFLLSSFAMLWGPWSHLRHLLSGPRLPFTALYASCLGATLYFALVSQSYMLTLMSAVCQVCALVWYIISYIPGGQTGLKFFSKVFYSAASKTASTVLPV